MTGESEAALDGVVPLVPFDELGRRWDVADGSVLREAVRQAIAAGRVDDLLTDPAFLVRADPDVVVAALDQAAGPPARLAAAVYRASVAQHADRSPAQRRDVLAVDAARHGELGWRDAFCAVPPVASWRPRWATGSQAGGALRATLPAHIHWHQAVACTRLGDRPVVVTGGFDGALRVWDMRTSALVGPPMEGHDGWIATVACTEIGGRPVAVTGGDDRTVRVWDLREGAQLGDALRGHDARVQAIACTALAGVPIAVTGDDGGGVRVWDLQESAALSDAFDAGGGVRAVACALVDGGPVAVILARDILVRDLVTGMAVRGPLTWWAGSELTRKETIEAIRRDIKPGPRFVDALVTAEIDGHPCAITAVAGRNSTVQIWDLAPIADDRPVPPPRDTWRRRDIRRRRKALGLAPVGALRSELPVARQPRSLAHTELDGRPVLVVGEIGEQVQVVDVDTGATIREITADATTVSCGRDGDRPVAVSSSQTENVMIWDLADGTEPESSCVGFTDPVTALLAVELDGRPAVVASAGRAYHDKLRVWDLADGRSLGGFRFEPVGALDQMAGASLGGRPVAVVLSCTTADYTTVEVLDLADRTGLGHEQIIEYTEVVNVLACAVVEGRPVVVTGSRAGMVRVWDLASGAPVGEPMTGHTGAVGSVACTDLGGRPVAVTGGGLEDSSVRLWDLTTCGPIGEPLRGHTADVAAVACTEVEGRPVAVTAGGYDRTVRTFDLRDQVPSGEPLTGHTGYVDTVCCTRLEGRPVAVTAATESGGRAKHVDPTVRIWDLVERREIHRVELPRMPSTLASYDDGTVVAAVGWDIVVLEPWVGQRRRS